MMAAPITSCVEVALAYARQGWLVLPVNEATKKPVSKHGVDDATSIEGRVLSLWDEHPDAGVGVAGGGAARLVIIDVDALESFSQLKAELGELPATRAARTPRGGSHFYLRWPGSGQITAKNSVNRLAKKVDVRSVSGYVVAPPSNGYVWTCEAEVAEMPPAWAARLEELARPKRSVPRPQPPRPPAGPAASYADAALRRAVEAVRAAHEGERNMTLNREAYSLAGLVAAGELVEGTVRDELMAAAAAAGLPQVEAGKTVDSGFAAGLTRPRVVPQRTTGGGPPAAPPPPPPPTSGDRAQWEQMLRYDHRGNLSKDAGNAALLLGHAEHWSGCLEYDAFGDAIRWASAPPAVPGFESPKKGDDFEEWQVTYVAHALAKLAGVAFAKAAVWDAIVAAARVRTSHPLQDYLQGLKWDGYSRVDGWLSRYLRAASTPYTQAVGRWWLISAVARALNPGCQADHTLVLEGLQGAGKTTAVRILAGDWYLGSLPDLRDKDAVQVLRGRWLIELGELDALRGAARTRVKDFATQNIDCYRPSYGRQTVRRPRCCVFVGTTNEHVYLDDPTGGRRWWGVPVGTCDREALAADRDQLWAEAVSYYLDGAEWCPSPELADTIAAEQDARYQGDPWEERIERWVSTSTGDFTIGQVLGGALGLEPSKWDRACQTRAGHCLSRLGFESYRPRTGGDRVRRYRRKETLGLFDDDARP